MEALEQMSRECELPRATFTLDQIMALWKELQARRGSIGLAVFLEGVMLLAFCRTNPTYQFKTEARALAIVPLSSCLEMVVNKYFCRMAVVKVEMLSPHYEENVTAWPFTRPQRRALKADQKKVKREMISQRDEIKRKIKVSLVAKRKAQERARIDEVRRHAVQWK